MLTSFANRKVSGLLKEISMAAERTDNVEVVNTKSPDGRAWRESLDFYLGREELKMKNMLKLLSLGIAAVCIFIKVPTASATTLIKYTFEEVTSKSEKVVDAVVIAKASRPSDDGKTAYTYVTLRRLQNFKGEAAPRFTLRFMGGDTPKGRIAVVAMPELQAGRRYILFIGNESDMFCPIRGWHQGVFEVKADVGGKNYITDYAGRKILGISGGDVVKEPIKRDPNRLKPVIKGTSPGITARILEDGQSQEEAIKPLSRNEFTLQLSALIAELKNKPLVEEEKPLPPQGRLGLYSFKGYPLSPGQPRPKGRIPKPPIFNNVQPEDLPLPEVLERKAPLKQEVPIEKSEQP